MPQGTGMCFQKARGWCLMGFETESCWVCPNCEALVPNDQDCCPKCGYSEAIDDLEGEK